MSPQMGGIDYLGTEFDVLPEECSTVYDYQSSYHKSGKDNQTDNSS